MKAMLIHTSLLNEVKNIINHAKEKAIRAVDNERVLMYWHIGKVIFEEEQQGKDRADYGTYLIQYLSEQLQPEFGSGCSRRQLELIRQFYRVFPIAQTVSAQLTWSHYVLLVRIEDEYKREY